MLICISADNRTGQMVPISDIPYYEENKIPLYNRTDDGKILEWFDGENWIFPRPQQRRSSTASLINSELLAKISDQLEVLISNTQEQSI